MGECTQLRYETACYQIAHAVTRFSCESAHEQSAGRQEEVVKAVAG